MTCLYLILLGIFIALRLLCELGQSFAKLRRPIVIYNVNANIILIPLLQFNVILSHIFTRL